MRLACLHLFVLALLGTFRCAEAKAACIGAATSHEEMRLNRASPSIKRLESVPSLDFPGIVSEASRPVFRKFFVQVLPELAVGLIGPREFLFRSGLSPPAFRA